MVRIPLNEGTPLQNKYYSQKIEINLKEQDREHHARRKTKALYFYHVTYMLRVKLHSLTS